jgi:hypothetical protein
MNNWCRNLWLRAWLSPSFVRHGETIEILVLERVCLCRHGKHFWRKKLAKRLLISTLDKVFYFKGTFLQDSTKTSLPAEKIPFFNMRLLVLRFLWVKHRIKGGTVAKHTYVRRE